MVTDIVQSAISSFDGVEFSSLAACPYCGGPVQGYDTRQKKYAVIRDTGAERTIMVRIKRFTCRNCKKLSNADEPFYAGTRIGSLVVDLFFTFSATMPENRAARLIDAMGIRVDRTSWKNYTGRLKPEIQVTDIFGMQLPSSVLTLSGLAARVPDGGRLAGADALEACRYPSVCRAEPCLPHYGEDMGGTGETERGRKTASLHPAETQSGPVSGQGGPRESSPDAIATSTIRL